MTRSGRSLITNWGHELRQKITIALITGVAIVISACEVSVNTTQNSSKGGNDYAAEPLSGAVKDYAQALNTSNRFIELFAVDRDIVAAYELLQSDLQDNVSLEQLTEIRSQADTQQGVGQFVEYLPGQWAFTRHSEGDNELLISVKIARFEKEQMFFLFVFEADNQNEITGFQWLRRENEEKVSDFLSRVLQRQ